MSSRILRKIVTKRIYKLQAAGIQATEFPTKLIAITNGGSMQQIAPEQVKQFINGFATQQKSDFCEKIEMPWNKSYSICRVNSTTFAQNIIQKTQNQKYKIQG